MIRRPAMWLFAVLTLCALSAPRVQAVELRTETVVYKQGDTELHGYLAYDAQSKAKRPGVLVVHEWWGLNDHARAKARALAELGYVALAIDMYGEGKSTDHPEQAGEWATWIRNHKDVAAARFKAGYELLASQKLTKKGEIAAIGYCFGGSIVLTMAMNGADLKGVVSFHGGLPTDPAGVDHIPAKILVCHGGSDPTMSQEQIHTFLSNLDAVGADYQFIIYGGAKHSFTNKAADARGVPALAYNADADRRSWNAMLTFFDEIFKQ
jgi:dienelactone hydrolase